MASDREELQALYDVVRRLVAELERIALLEDDAERGLAFKRFLRSSSPVLPVPDPTRGRKK